MIKQLFELRNNLVTEEIKYEVDYGEEIEAIDILLKHLIVEEQKQKTIGVGGFE